MSADTHRFAKGEPLADTDINLFGVFDGHGGSKCSNYLKDNFFNALLSRKEFLEDVTLALKHCFVTVDEAFLKLADHPDLSAVDRSGSCALVALIVSKLE